MSLGRAVTLAVERIVDPVEGMHRAIARPWVAALGALTNPARVVHDGLSRLVYRSIRIGAVAVGLGLDALTAVDSSAAGAARAFANGLWGDTLGRHETGLGTPMSLRDRRGAPVPSGPELAAAFPQATGRLVVLVHGLITTEQCWHGTGARPGLIRSLEDHPALTPVAVRYNSGLPVATNGAQLASLLEEVCAHWPLPVQSIALVGHSMGGLVIRSAYAVGRRDGHRWIEHVGDVVTIGSPHRGAPLEKLVNAAARGLGVAPQTRPLADFLDTRSQGIKDLRHGGIGLADHPEQGVGSPPSAVKQHIVAGVITSDPAHPVGAVFGDLMVRLSSSTGAPAPDPSNVVVLGGMRHFDLPHEPVVIDHVMGWLAPHPA